MRARRLGAMLLDGEEEGSVAMLRDLEMLAGLDEGSARVACRCHGWAKPCLSYGHAQQLPADLCEAAQNARIATVQRPTGGGWLLHLKGDLAVTFALAAPLRPGEFRQAARWLAEMIAAGCRDLGLDAAVVGQDLLPPTRSDICFARIDKNEIVVAGVKIAGVALARIRRAVLAQAALPLAPAPPSIVDFEQRWDPSRRSAEKVLAGIDAASLAAAVGNAIANDQVKKAAIDSRSVE